MTVTEMLLKLQNVENTLKQEKRKNKREELQSEIILIKAQIPANIVSRFYKLYKRDGKAIVKGNDGVCHGCFLNMPLSQASVIGFSDELSTCHHCGRYLYIDKKETIAIS